MDTTLTAGLRLTDAIPLPGAAPIAGRAARSDAYPVFITRSRAAALARLEELIGDAGAVVLADATVEALYGAELIDALRERPRDVTAQTLAPGEASKSVGEAVRLWDWLARGATARRDVLIAFGGGVTCDLGGWVASAYMRGIPYVNVPTTLLAMVDGALGGKVAANHPVAKNLIGAFYQPAGVVADVGYLRSLERRHLSAGVAECVKKAMIASPAYWELIEDSAEALVTGDLDALEALVRAAAAIKLELIARDPYEEDLRRPLNFGHTVGHPLETVTGYGPLLHGEAVALGMVVEATIAAERGLLAPALLEALVDLLRRCRLPVRGGDLRAPAGADDVVRAMGKVRLIRAGSLRYVLPAALGETVIADDVSEDELRGALRACGIT